MHHYKRNPEIKVAIKHPNGPLTTVFMESSNYNQEFKKIINAHYELHTVVRTSEGGTIIMAIDEYGAYKDLLFNFNFHSSPIKGIAIFIKEASDGKLTSLNNKDLRNLRKYVGDLSQNPY